MEIKTTFHNMPHSNALEEHAHKKMEKIETLFRNGSDDHPLFVELFLNAQTAHAHHNVELHIKTEHFNLVSHSENSDMYIATDQAIEKMVNLVRKEKSRYDDKKKKVTNEKRAFEQ